MLGMLSTKDILVLAAYLFSVLAAGFYFSLRKKTADDYFLARRKVGWIAIGTSLFAANMSSEQFLLLTAAGSTSGLAIVQLELLACLIILLLAWIFAPLYVNAGVVTMPEFLEKRYNSTARWYLTVVSTTAYVLIRISVSLYAGGILLKAAVGWDMTTSAIIIVIATGLYSVVGGLSAIIYTNGIQAVVLFIGSLVLTRVGLKEAGGWHQIVASTPSEFWHMFKPMSHPDFPWTGVVFGAPVLAIWYWCTDQYIVQRVLGAKNMDNARRGSILAAFLKAFSVFIIVLPGIIALKLSGGNVSGDNAYAWLATTFLRSGVRGFVIAGLLATLMSSLSGLFHSTSTLLTVDIYKRLKPNANERSLVNFGRVGTGAIVLISLASIPFVSLLSGGRMYLSMQTIQGYIAPPTAACFLFGVFWSRANSKGAVASLFTGLVLGAFRFILEMQAKTNSLENEFLQEIAAMNFLHCAIVLFFVCSAVLVGVSLATNAPNGRPIANFTFSGTARLLKEKTGYHSLNAVASILLVLLVLGLLWVLR